MDITSTPFPRPLHPCWRLVGGETNAIRRRPRTRTWPSHLHTHSTTARFPMPRIGNGVVKLNRTPFSTGFAAMFVMLSGLAACPTGLAATLRGPTKSHLQQIQKLSHSTASSNGSVATAVAVAFDRYNPLLTEHGPSWFSFLRWHPSRVSVAPTAWRQRPLAPHANCGGTRI
ncbi:hypothetical protein DFH94DRAFT_399754 [Russula ochroleuca]|uniref:Uncharacterized protein n=1 Tax=Russula ochroleuca TaxID=152965 RepID=A0A9P5MXW1_9AGAM|nr:hypothetical protein DFH94DRAFT_399754 [Russula ochroleuca]